MVGVCVLHLVVVDKIVVGAYFVESFGWLTWTSMWWNLYCGL